MSGAEYSWEISVFPPFFSAEEILAEVAFLTGIFCFVAGALALADGFSVGVGATDLASAVFFGSAFFVAAFATGFAVAALVVEPSHA